MPSLATAAPNCPVLGPLGFGVSLTNSGAALGTYLTLLTIDTATPVGAGQMRADGGDLRVSDAACSSYDFWVESGFNTAATRIWVKVPAVPAGESSFFVHHGDLTATRVNQASEVFGAGIASLYTFTEGTGTTIHDWVGGHDLQMQGTAAWTTGPRGEVGGINNLGSTGRLFSAGNGAQLGNGDFSAFVMVNLPAGDRNGSTRGLIGNYNNDGSNGWILKMQGGAGQFMLLTNQGGGWCQSGSGTVAADTWSMLGGRRQAGVTNSLFQNGAAVANICTNDTRDLNGSGPFEIGRGYNGTAGYAISGVASMALVYTRALPDAEASSLYTSLFPAVPPVVAITATPPAPPTITSATSTATSITLSFSAGGDSGSPITGYTATCTAGAAVSQSGPSSPLTVSGLAPALSYTCTVSASNLLGTSLPSAPVLISTNVPPAITSAAVATFTEFTPGTFTVTATGAPAPALSLTGALPAGVTFNAATGVLGGTPAVGTAGIYTLTVTASNGALPNATQTFTLTVNSAVPNAPANVQVAATGALVSLSWEPAVSGAPAEWFQIELGNVSGLTNLLTHLTRAPGEIGLLPSGTYYLRVRGVNRAGLSAPSAEVTVQVSAGELMSGPVNGVNATVTGDAVTIGWQPSTIGISPIGYRLEVGQAHGGTDVGILDLPASSTVFSMSGVPPGVYSARVRALSPGGLTPPSHDVMFMVGQPAGCATVPSRPVLLTPVVVGSTAALAWMPQDDFASTAGYSLRVGTTSGASDLGVFSTPSPASALVATAPNGFYYLQLVANNTCGESAGSAEQILTVGAALPAAPTALTGQALGDAVTLNWTAPPGGVTGYVLEVGIAAGATEISLPTGSATPMFTVSGVPSGTYFLRVRAQNSAGVGAASNEVTVVVP